MTPPKPQFAQLACGSAIARFGWVEGVDMVSIVFYDNNDCHGTETMTREQGRKYWKKLLKAGYKVEKDPVINMTDELALSNVKEGKRDDTFERFLAS